jgi:hypothetical protein
MLAGKDWKDFQSCFVPKLCIFLKQSSYPLSPCSDVCSMPFSKCRTPISKCQHVAKKQENSNSIKSTTCIKTFISEIISESVHNTAILRHQLQKSVFMYLFIVEFCF